MRRSEVASDRPGVANRGVAPVPVEFELRPITDSDLPFLFRVYAGTRTEELSVVPWSNQQKHDFLLMQFEAQHRHYLGHYPGAQLSVVVTGGEPVGRFYVHRLRDETRIVDIAILPEHRGRGLGSALLGQLISESQTTGRPITIHVERNNPAQAWYLRHGFRPTEDRGVYCFLTRAAELGS